MQESVLKELGHDRITKLLDCISCQALRFRNRAAAVLSYYNRITARHIAKLLGVSPSTVCSWVTSFKTQDIERFLRPCASDYRKTRDRKYVDAVFEVLHAPPASYGINRTTWRIEDIQSVMSKRGLSIARINISKIIKDAGYRYRKARRVLTSNDPAYREKLQQITRILSTLGAREKFFSVDEFGPLAVKIQGGRSLVPPGRTRCVPQCQRSKGSIIITGALELSTNQITHFYSPNKNTTEMLKLLDILVKKYADQDCIYFSWDCASWHASKALYERVAEINTGSGKGSPKVKLVPLPVSAQFLNVIESVFSGMARAVIHNSNYESVAVCKKAIDRHFAKRNRCFRKNPKRAGNKIWGDERVKACFSESNNCKDPRY